MTRILLIIVSLSFLLAGCGSAKSSGVLLHPQYGEECMIVKKGAKIGEYEAIGDGLFMTDRVVLDIVMGIVEEIEKHREGQSREYRF